MRRYVWSGNLKNKETIARVRPQRHRENKWSNYSTWEFVTQIVRFLVLALYLPERRHDAHHFIVVG